MADNKEATTRALNYLKDGILVGLSQGELLRREQAVRETLGVHKTVQADKFYVTGDVPDRIEGYAVRKVVDEEGVALCSFHGPMSVTAAMAFCIALRDGTSPKVMELSNYVRQPEEQK